MTNMPALGDFADKSPVGDTIGFVAFALSNAKTAIPVFVGGAIPQPASAKRIELHSGHQPVGIRKALENAFDRGVHRITTTQSVVMNFAVTVRTVFLAAAWMDTDLYGLGGYANPTI